MTMFRSLPLALALTLAPMPLLAQAGSPPPGGQSDADALADQVRRLGANPLDRDALLTAGELSVRLGDLSAAGAFFARAEKVAPGDARVKAGEGAILVHSERPGEALRLFAQAEALGLPIAQFAADRGLAYDLIGDQPRAQRDYRTALSAQFDDETTRRYALSLGISGRQQQALDQLAPLVRHDDRGAWRTRAFILAMGGNTAEASRIAATMMPPGSAQGLATFFAQLPTLPAVDRAFAVHFGEVHASPSRLADARLAPALAPLPAEPAPIQVAAAKAPVNDHGKRHKDKKGPIVAAVQPPVPDEPVLQPPAYQAPVYQPPVSPYASRPGQAIAANTAQADRPLTDGERASLTAAGLRIAPARRNGQVVPQFVIPANPYRVLTPAEQASVAAATSAERAGRHRRTPTPPQPTPPVQAPPPVQAVAAVAPTAVPAATTVPPPIIAATPPRAAPTVAAVVPTPAVSPVTAPSSAVALQAPSAGVTQPPRSQSMAVAAAPRPVVALPAVPPSPTVATQVASAALAPPPSTTVLPGPVSPPAAVTPTSEAVAAVIAAPVEAPPMSLPPVSPAQPLAVVRRAPRPQRRARGDADDILGKIVAGLTVPAAELGVGAEQRTGAGATSHRNVEPRLAPDAPDTVADKKAAARKLAADKKAAAAARQAALDKQAAAAQEAAAKKAARAEPARIWVQVAGGANPKDLAKAWSATKSKAPGAFGGHQGWTTPLRSTNRVLTGPFKTDADARAYVNQLAKSGVSAFTFTSDPGQKVSRLDSK